MKLSEIDFSKLADRTHPDRWGANTARDRHVFSNEDYWYKIWGKEYLAKSGCFYGDKYKPVKNLRQPHGFEVGLFSDDISSSFVSYIYDDEDMVRGYITRTGEEIEAVPGIFARAVFDACVRTGWVFSDLGPKNVVLIDGLPSLIDFDTHLAALDELDLAFEEKSGALRPHISPAFRDLLKKYVQRTL